MDSSFTVLVMLLGVMGVILGWLIWVVVKLEVRMIGLEAQKEAIKDMYIEQSVELDYARSELFAMFKGLERTAGSMPPNTFPAYMPETDEEMNMYPHLRDAIKKMRDR